MSSFSNSSTFSGTRYIFSLSSARVLSLLGLQGIIVWGNMTEGRNLAILEAWKTKNFTRK
jgi:hypothetical protein